MNKIYKLWIIFLLIILVIVGCRLKEDTAQDVYLDFQNKIKKIESYTCMAYITAINNKNKQSYITKHTYKKPEYYKLEVVSPDNIKGKTIEYLSDKIILTNNKLNSKVELPNIGENRLYLFVGDFINTYLNSESLEINLDGDNLVLEAASEKEGSYIKKQILYIDKKTKNPVKMEILDNEGNQKFIVDYKDFKIQK